MRQSFQNSKTDKETENIYNIQQQNICSNSRSNKSFNFASFYQNCYNAECSQNYDFWIFESKLNYSSFNQNCYYDVCAKSECAGERRRSVCVGSALAAGQTRPLVLRTPSWTCVHYQIISYCVTNRYQVYCILCLVCVCLITIFACENVAVIIRGVNRRVISPSLPNSVIREGQPKVHFSEILRGLQREKFKGQP